jgi:hypothetical protein
MNNAVNKLTKTVLKNDSLADCSVSQVQVLAEQYPYFAASQILLAAKLKETGTADLESQLQKTLLYINNPFWLNRILKTDKPATELQNQTHTETLKAEVPVTVEYKQATTEAIIEETEEEIYDETTEIEEDESILNIKLPSLDMTAVSADTELSLNFEPYHRVDYFASQGIKVETALHKDDKLGHKLKSFTDWLKVMKKLPESDKVNQIDSGIEQKVITLAEHSLTERDIVTEAMAEVWEKQGKNEKAIDTYHKLSLLYPDKSTYFASKIDLLKK